MGNPRNTDGMFRNLKYNQYSAPEVTKAMTRKVENVSLKIKEREARMARTMEEYKITPERFSDLLIEYMQNERTSYSNSSAPTNRNPTNTTIPAGVVSSLVTERQLIESEKCEVKKMNLILANLMYTEAVSHPTTGDVIRREAYHQLTDDEIEYLDMNRNSSR